MRALVQTVEVGMLESLLGYASKLLAMILIFLAPIKATMIAIGFLVFADLISGILAARKRKEKITSNGLRNTISKTLAYLLAIISGFVVETILMPDFPMVKIIVAMISLTEIKSLFENFHTITGIDFLSELLKKFHGNKKVFKKSRKKVK